MADSENLLRLVPRPPRPLPREGVSPSSAAVKAPELDINTKVFTKEMVDVAGEQEYIVRGGRDKFFVAGGVEEHPIHRRHRWGSQAPAQAQNFRDSLAEAGLADQISVSIGLRPDSKSNEEARKLDFTEEKGTLGETFDVISKSDLAISFDFGRRSSEDVPENFGRNEARIDVGFVSRVLIGCYEIRRRGI